MTGMTGQINNNYLATLIILGLLLLIAATVHADAPLLIHYQGRVTNSTGGPIVVPTNFVFSLWRGGTASQANSGTQFYSESATLDPDAQGIFEHQVGSGTILSGQLTAAAFDTIEPVFLQVALPSGILLPRARVTSVGYAFVATNAVGDITPRTVSIAGFGTVIDNLGRWTGSQEGLPGTNPLTVTDLTGGNTVVGDRVAITGTNLTNTRVEVGGLPANILSQTATRIEFRVPAGVDDGISPVEVINTNGITRLAGHVDVRRLIVWVTPFITAIVDARTRTIVTTFNFTVGTDKLPVQMAFGFDGALAFVPGNNTGNLLQIDLTANPPTSTFVGLGTNSSRAIAISPDNRMAIISLNSSSINQLRLFTIQDPTLGNVFQNFTTFFFPSGFSGPRGSVFVGDNMFIVSAESSGELLALRRVVATNTLFLAQFDITSEFLKNRVSAGNTPFSLRLTRDRQRLFVVNRGQNNVLVYFIAPEGFTSSVTSQPAGFDALDVAITPDDNNVFVADQDQDLLHAYNLTGGTLTQVGYLEGLPDDQTDIQMAAIDPFNGSLLAVGTDNSSLRFYERDGMVLTFLDQVGLTGLNRQTIELEFQP